MSLTVTRAAWRHSKATGNARLVLLALADYASEEKVKRGEPALAYPSQQNLADMCACARSTVELALKALTKLGEITDTGVRHWGKYRGTVEWEVLPGVDLTDSESGHDDMTDSRSGGQGDEADLTDSRHDLTDSQRHLTDSGGLPDRPVGHKPVVEPVVNPVVEPGRSPSAPDISSPPANSNGNRNSPSLADDLTPEHQHVGERDGRPPAIAQAEVEEQKRLLAELEADLKRKPDHRPTQEAIEAVRAQLAGTADQLAAEAGVELVEAAP